jgi:hypothetical protein
MSENEIVELIRKNIENPTISTDTGLAAAQEIGRIAARERVEWALAGGVAMYLYGSPRLTKDVDIVASAHLSLQPEAQLSFGGSHYTVEVGKYKVTVDWIVRSDGYAKYYRKALTEAVQLPSGMKIIAPEWLVILKILAGRQRDYDDAMFLLGQKDLVNRPLIKQKIVDVAGEDAWLALMPAFRRLCSLADGKTDEPNKYYDEE